MCFINESKKMTTFQIFVVTLFYCVCLIHSNPLEDPNICGNPVCKGSEKFKYGPGTEQNYKYSIQIISLFNGTSKNESTMHLDGTASFSFLSPCDGILTLSDFKLTETQKQYHLNSDTLSDMITKNSLRFSFNDGIISEVCPQDEENTWSLNFKRGILSMLHNTMKRLDLDHEGIEEDVRGKCSTKYKILGTKETSLLIEKSKDSQSCEHNSKLHSVIQSTPYNFQLKHTEKVVKSESICQLSIDHNIYNEIECREKHVFQPFSNQNSGAITTIVQKLSLINEVEFKVGEENEITRREALIYDHTPIAKPTHGELKESRDLIKRLCKQNNEDLQIKFSDLFSKFIRTLRILSYPTLTALYGHSARTCVTGKKHLLDALPFINTAASVSLMKDIILKENLPANTANEWILSIALIPRPDISTLKAAVQLLEKKPLQPNVAFSVSSLTHTYCIHHSKCLSEETVQKVRNIFETQIKKIYSQPRFDRQSTDLIIVLLKALSNIGIISDNFRYEQLYKMIEDDNLDTSIRLAAVESFRRTPCDETKNYFQSLFRNQNGNVEIRIASYLQLMKCPTYLLIRTIKHSLEQEEVNQVGSFIWSHLHNIIKTSVPSKVEIQSLLSEKDLVKKFSTDVRKFSQNIEGSMYFDEYSFGGNYESNIIFSPTSYVPKTAMLNLTFDLFGESINLFEFYGRVEGLEHYLESMFGPKGAVTQNIKDKIPKLRWARDTEDNNIIKNQIENLPNIVQNDFKDPKVALGVKMFGNEIKYNTFSGEKEIFDAIKHLNPIEYLKRLLSGKEIKYNKASMFLDTNYVIPTGAGLPLSLNAIGTASVNMKLLGSLNTAGFAKSKEIDLTADIQPTVSIDISGEMTTDLFYASTGIKLKTSMYTATAIKGVVKVRGAKLVSVKFSLPRQNTEIFGVKSELFVKQNNIEHSQSGLSKNRISQSICSWSALEQTVGLKLCTDYYFVNITKVNKSMAPHFLLAGPAAYHWYLNKSDPASKTYIFEYKLTQNADNSIMSVTFDTPDSSIKRLLDANITIDGQTKNLTMILQSTAGTILVKGRMKDTEDEKYLEMDFDINNKKHFDVSVSLVRNRIQNGFNFFPKAYLGVNGERIVEVQGSLEVISKKDVTQYAVDLKFQTKRLRSKLSGYVLKTEASLSSDLYLDYKFVRVKEQRIHLAFSIGNRSRKNLTILSGNCMLNSTSYPNYNFNSNLTFTKSSSHLDLRVSLKQNPLQENDPNAEKQTLVMEWVVSFKSFPDSKKTFDTVLLIHRNSSNLNLKGQLSYKTFRTDVNIGVSVNYGNNKEVSVTLFWSHPRATYEQIRAHLSVTVPTFTPMILKLELQEMASGDWQIDVSGTWFSGHSMSAVGLYQDKGTALAADHHLKLFLKSPNFQDISIDLEYFRDNDNLRFDLKGIQDQIEYILYLNYTNVSPVEVKTLAKIKYKSKLYTLQYHAYNGDHTKINVELKLDQLRDVQFTIWGYNQELHKAAGFEINWDANRDPSQKLIVAATYTKIESLNYKGDMIIGYPGRTIIGKYNFLLKEAHLDTLVSLSWDDDKTFAIQLSVNYNNSDGTSVDVMSRINTPFDEVMDVKGKFFHKLNLYTFTSFILWKNRQKITIDLFGDYSKKDDKFKFEYRCALNGSETFIPNWNASIKHDQNLTNFDSILHLKYNTDFLVDVNSKWKVHIDDVFTNLTGTILTTTPFHGFNKGLLISKISLRDKYLKGIASLDVDHKKVTINAQGKYAKLTDSMLIINMTTSDEEYQCKFILSKEQKQLVAMATYPSGQTGIEILLQVNTLSDFDVKFQLGTPIEFLRQVIIFGKLKRGTADFRLGWNFLVLGFSGVWRYTHLTDFQYVYKIYTPLEGYEENGVVAKLELDDGLDLEASVKVTNYKLGIKLVGKSDSKTLDEMDISMETIQEIYPQTNNETEIINWTGLVELDIIVYPTMKGKVEIDQAGPHYVLKGKLLLPHGEAVIVDELDYYSVLDIRNKLTLTTPYVSFNNLLSEIDFEIKPGFSYTVGLTINYTNKTEAINNQVYVKYVFDCSEHQRNYDITAKFITPFKTVPYLNIDGGYHSVDNFIKSKIIYSTLTSNISLEGAAAIEGNLLNVNTNISVSTPILYIPNCEVYLTKQFSFSQNFIEITVKIPERFKSQFHLKAVWVFRQFQHYQAILQLETPISGMENSTIGVEFVPSRLKNSVWAAVQLFPIEAELKSNFSHNLLVVDSYLSIRKDKYPLKINCKITEPLPRRLEYDGNLNFNDIVYKIGGHSEFAKSIPIKTLITLTHNNELAPPVKFEYNINSTVDGYKLIGNVQYSDKITKFNAHVISNDKSDWNMNVQVKPPDNKIYVLNVTIANGDTKTILINAETPIPKLQHPKAGGSISRSGIKTKLNGFFELNTSKGSISLDYIWLFMENMFIDYLGKYENTEYSSQSTVNLFYRNPQQQFHHLQVGGDVKIDKLWQAISNVTLDLPDTQDIGVEAHFKLPSDIRELYSIFGKLNYGEKFKMIEYLAKYRTSYTQKKFGSWGNINLENKQDLKGNIEIEWKGLRFNNFANVKLLENDYDFLYKLKSPKYTDKQYLISKVHYKLNDDFHNIKCELEHPEHTSVAFSNINYKEFGNMDGHINVSIPYKNLKYVGSLFKTETNRNIYNRFVKIFWNNITAIVDGKFNTKTGPTLLESNTKGNIIVELPLATRHIANINCEYNKKRQESIGLVTVVYNKTKVLDGNYNCKSESRAGFNKDVIHVELKNKMVPIGADYIRSYEYQTPKDGYNTPTIDKKYLHLYNLQNRSKFNVSTEIQLETTYTGQNYILKATHLNRTIKLWTDYDVQDKTYNQHSKIELSPTAWLEYNLEVINHTENEFSDIQTIYLNISHPRRNVTARGFYHVDDANVTTDVLLMWDRDNKTVQAGFDWRKLELHRDSFEFSIKHPSFEEDILLSSIYGFNKNSADGKIVVSYSKNPDQKLTLSGSVINKSNKNSYNYTYELQGRHDATNLNLNTQGDFYWNSNGYGTEHYAQYRRSYLPLLKEETLARVNHKRNELELKRERVSGLSYLKTRYGGKFPIYTANITAIHGINDTSGEFHLDLKEKLVYCNVNMTKDGTQSLHLYGFIPDARNAIMDIWRDYDDKRVSDLSYFLRLNHSRLVVSKLSWRPDLLPNLKASVRGYVERVYLEILENINDTKQYIRSETIEAINGIWQDAKPLTHDFIADLRNLTVIENDIEDLKKFINNSYHANEFYIKDISKAVLTMFDEMALKSHLQSLPKVFQEIWNVMGESGLKIKKGILWVIEKIKIYYKNTTDFIHRLIYGDPIEQFSELFKDFVEKYDDFIKNIHVSFIQYMEQLWSQTYDLMIDHWHKTLAAIEPSFIKFLHYLETILWNTSKDFLDFLYIRKSEIIESLYFVSFTHFSQDVDRFYKDITGPNTVASSIYKYSKIAWNFLKEKYLNSIPFGKELQDIILEIYTELSQLQKIPSINYLIEKYHESYEFARFYYDYLSVESRIHKILSLIYEKINDMSVTALEVENRQREAKTKFIFETADGIMLLEQKLPMSWHAFNETPKFQEIPEIKAVYDFQNYFVGSEASFWSIYYDYKPYLDPADWTPPFKGHAMIVGSKYYFTFDQRHYEYQGSCTYLLARDFLDGNFTIILSNDEINRTTELILLIDKSIVHINFFTDNVEIENSINSNLPAQLGETFIYREAGIVTVNSSLGYNLECNMKFHICTFEISGWYFGKTAGLWGTLNNEPSDDLLTSSKIKSNLTRIDEYGTSWALNKGKSCNRNNLRQAENSVPTKILSMCTEFFSSKISELTTCFPRVPKEPFESMCLNSTTEDEACTSAIAYINMCSYSNTPLRIPDTCVKCKLENGTLIQEGDMIHLEGNTVPQSADVVFIIEAKKCNKNFLRSKNFDLVIESLNKELLNQSLIENRYALVLFGGNGVYDQPRSVSINSNIFTDSKTILNFFNNIPIGEGNTDIFNAILFANKLIFRPGVSRTFVLVPCSKCNEYDMEYDYSIIHQLLFDNAVSLHIVMNDHFTVQKDRESKTICGIDQRLAYTKRDAKVLLGDALARKMTHLPKSTLGVCSSLALETNGSIFSGKYLETTDKTNVLKFISVFTKRVARTSIPNSCMKCECTAPNSGIAYMECYPCAYPKRTNLERVYDDEEMFNFMPPNTRNVIDNLF